MVIRECTKVGFAWFVVSVLLASAPAYATSDLDVFEELDKDSAFAISSVGESTSSGFEWLAGVRGNFDLNLGYKYRYRDNQLVEGEADKGINGPGRLRGDLKLEWQHSVSDRLKLQLSGRSLSYVESEGVSGTPSDATYYSSELLWGESYILWQLTNYWDVTLGKQIVTWGKGHVLRVNDVLNPRDLREIGVSQDTKIPLTMAKTDLFAGQFQLTALSIHEYQGHILPPVGDDYNSQAIEFPTETEQDILHEPELGVSVSGVIGPLELAYYKARYYNDFGSLTPTGQVILGEGTGDQVIPYDFVLTPSQIDHDGVAVSSTFGFWTITGELAQLRGIRTYPETDNNQRLDTLVGVSYNNSSDLFLALEGVIRDLKVADDQTPDELRDLEDKSQELAAMVRKTFWRNTLESQAMAVVLGKNGVQGSLLRLSQSYAIDDETKIYAVLVDYHKGEESPTFTHIENSDQFILGLNRSF